jgi:germination protein M
MDVGMRKFRLIALAAVLAFIGTACSSGGPRDGGSATTPTSTPTSSATSSPTPGMTTFEVWFGYGEWLFVTERTEPSGPRVATAAVNALLAGPSAVELAAGVGTSIPDGTELLGLSIDGGIATVDLSRTFESGGGSLSMFSRLAQLTYTLTQFPTVRGVNLESDGKPVTVFSGEGIILEQPMTRRSYRDRLPAILVQSPMIGEQVSSPVTISGTANVFEATVSITVLDAQGTEIASGFTTATCGTGCRGTYSTAVAFTVDQSQTGTVRVYEASAKDGHPINVVDIPVVLLP